MDLTIFIIFINLKKKKKNGIIYILFPFLSSRIIHHKRYIYIYISSRMMSVKLLNLDSNIADIGNKFSPLRNEICP